MNAPLRRLSGGNLQSDGRADDVARQVLRHPHLLGQLAEGLRDQDNVIRARTAHALEKISRTCPERLLVLLPQFIDLALRDQVPMVRWASGPGVRQLGGPR
jgi:hypothetical protein